MPISKRTTSVHAQLVEYETHLPPTETNARLDRALNRAEAGKLLPLLASAQNKDDIVRDLTALIGESGFIYFSALPHHNWLNKYFEKPAEEQFPATTIYTLGNPLIAQTILKHDLHAGLGIPPRLLVLGTPGGGTKILYHLPSSIMVPDAKASEELYSALVALDERLERFVETVLEEN
ncbi:hypothetical protein HGRIS_009816 [Hohenbuehelia grisea]|uniref:DUF302 domain-containing protein n=1 Tax=Hohenbuehelia grisea TaxID=104357 RepID=A0ABR3J2B2_9AGAR